uniref:Adenosine 3'-phospho 5'-phosphosulfate transporter 1 n=2 Tax=Clytia hemisphaerica TaxID=252671 RepID=A0A7M5XMB6_9CNID
VLGQGKWYQLLTCCIFGNEASPTGNKRSIFPCLSGDTTTATAIKLATCTIGLQVSYLTWGVLQEKVMTHKYGEGAQAVKFKNSEFLVFMNRIAAFIVAGLYIQITRSGQWNGPFYRFSFASLSNICSSWCQYEALRFVSFPTQVLGKASKMIPVMIMGRVVSKKTYQYYEYVVALMISVGVSLFLTATGSDKHNSTETTVSGLILMIGYMGFDSFTANWQSHMFTEYKVPSMQMMFNVNCFSCLFTSVPLLISGGMTYALAFMMVHPSFATHVGIISLTSVTGQMFIFYTLAEFGPLVFTTIMVTRNMLSILLSCIIYGHVLTSQAALGVSVVFCALFLQIYAKYRIKQKKSQQATNPREQSDTA